MVTYQTNHLITADEFIGVLKRSTLGERRPLDDRERIDGMLRNANLIVTAWDATALVGVVRCMTDFVYACYVSDVAVDRNYQLRGIGKALIGHTRAALGPLCKVRLISLQAAEGFYQKVGFVRNPNCWEITP